MITESRTLPPPVPGTAGPGAAPSSPPRSPTRFWGASHRRGSRRGRDRSQPRGQSPAGSRAALATPGSFSPLLSSSSHRQSPAAAAARPRPRSDRCIPNYTPHTARGSPNCPPPAASCTPNSLACTARCTPNPSPPTVHHTPDSPPHTAHCTPKSPTHTAHYTPSSPPHSTLHPQFPPMLHPNPSPCVLHPQFPLPAPPVPPVRRTPTTALHPTALAIQQPRQPSSVPVGFISLTSVARSSHGRLREPCPQPPCSPGSEQQPRATAAAAPGIPLSAALLQALGPPLAQRSLCFYFFLGKVVNQPWAL